MQVVKTSHPASGVNTRPLRSEMILDFALSLYETPSSALATPTSVASTAAAIGVPSHTRVMKYPQLMRRYGRNIRRRRPRAANRAPRTQPAPKHKTSTIAASAKRTPHFDFVENHSTHETNATVAKLGLSDFEKGPNLLATDRACLCLKGAWLRSSRHALRERGIADPSRESPCRWTRYVLCAAACRVLTRSETAYGPSPSKLCTSNAIAHMAGYSHPPPFDVKTKPLGE
jgi:hypothetical protein